MEEGKLLDKKSLRFLRGKNTDWDELAKDCISFANAHGGNILIGMEDHADLPPENQKIGDTSILEIIHKRIGQEINKNTIRWILKQLVDNNKLEVVGINRWARYSIAKKLL